MPWLTGDAIPEDEFCRVIRVPNDPTFIHAVSGALLELTYAGNWEQQGTLTPEQQAEAFDQVYIDFSQSICEEAVEVQHPETFMVMCHQFIAVAGVLLVPVLSAVSMYNVRRLFNAPALNQEFKATFTAAPGIWDIYCVAHRQNNAAIFTPYVDGVAYTSWDLYAAAAANNIQFSVALGVEITDGGLHQVNIKATSKNGASTSYNLPFTCIFGYKVADLP